jgi:hypothetical protein
MRFFDREKELYYLKTYCQKSSGGILKRIGEGKRDIKYVMQK